MTGIIPVLKKNTPLESKKDSGGFCFIRTRRSSGVNPGTQILHSRCGEKLEMLFFPVRTGLAHGFVEGD